MRELRPEDCIGEEVIVTGAYGDKWKGKAVAYSDKPSVLIEYEDGSRMMLPAKNMRLANPPKPWHDAKPGEVWVLTYGGQETAYVWTDRHSEQGHAFVSDRAIVEADDLDITVGRRIWPEDSNDS